MFKLPEFDFSGATFLSQETIQYHYGKHHRSYVENLNKLTAGLPIKDILELVRGKDGTLYNNAAQTWNHTFYWMGLTPGPSHAAADSKLAKAIRVDFGSEAKLKNEFAVSALLLFGSGWTWLAHNRRSEKIEIINTSNADLIDFDRYAPLLICDVWEHAYYVDFRNNRANYVSRFWDAINWSFVEENFETSVLKKVGLLLMP